MHGISGGDEGDPARHPPLRRWKSSRGRNIDQQQRSASIASCCRTMNSTSIHRLCRANNDARKPAFFLHRPVCLERDYRLIS